MNNKEQAIQKDPTSYLISKGFDVQREGKHLSVRVGENEVYRVTHKHEKWLWCHKNGSGGGDNIALVQEIEPGTNFFEAISRILGSEEIADFKESLTLEKEIPKLPKQYQDDVLIGREYLNKVRNISDKSIFLFESRNILRYCSDGILFCGYDEKGVIRNVTKRSINKEDMIQKRDFFNSDKKYPPLFLGKSETLWIVEGGIDALALLDIAKKKGIFDFPSIIITGGANVCNFFDNSIILNLLKGIKKIYISCDREKNDEVQQRTNKAHEKQFRRAKEFCANVSLWIPPESYKDLAEVNKN